MVEVPASTRDNVNDAGRIDSKDAMSTLIRDVQEAVEIHGDSAGRDKAGAGRGNAVGGGIAATARDDALRTGGVGDDDVVGGARLSNVEVVELVNEEGNRRVESSDIAGIDGCHQRRSG